MVIVEVNIEERRERKREEKVIRMEDRGLNRK